MRLASFNLLYRGSGVNLLWSCCPGSDGVVVEWWVCFCEDSLRLNICERGGAVFSVARNAVTICH